VRVGGGAVRGVLLGTALGVVPGLVGGHLLQGALDVVELLLVLGRERLFLVARVGTLVATLVPGPGRRGGVGVARIAVGRLTVGSGLGLVGLRSLVGVPGLAGLFARGLGLL